MAKTRRDRGLELELRVARMEWAEGAFARVRVPVTGVGSSGRRVLTDIDVLALDFDTRLRRRSSMFECKSRGRQAGEPDRLFWLAGFARYIGADRATLIRPTVSSRGRELARRLNLETSDIRTLERREEDNAWVPPGFGHLGGAACTSAQRRAGEQIKKLGGFPPKLWAFLQSSALFEEVPQNPWCIGKPKGDHTSGRTSPGTG